MSTRFYYGQKDYIVQLNLMDDAFQGGPYSAMPLAGGTFTGAVISATGTAALPAIGIGAANTGLWRPAANQIGMSINGTNIATWSSTGLSLVTALSIANGGTGATTVSAALTAIASGAGSAALIGNTPAGGIVAGTVQAALNELDTKKTAATVLAATGGGALVGNTPAGNIVATNVQAALNELDTKKAKLNGDVAQDFVMASQNGGPLAGFRNVIINGKFDIWQRGTSISVPAGAVTYTADRWCAAFAGSGNGTVAQALFGTSAGPFPLDGSVCVVTQLAGMAGSNLRQRVESVATLNGTSISFSFYARNTSGSTTLTCSAVQSFGTGGSPSADVTTGLTGSAVLTGSYVKYTFTGTIPSIAGKVLGTGGNDYLEIQIGSSSNSACSWAITAVQLEQGTAATPFERRHIGLELGLCQRYYAKTFSLAVAPAVNLGTTGALFYGGNGTTGYQGARWFFPVTMRTSPTLTSYNPGSGTSTSWRDVANNADSAFGSIALNQYGVFAALAASASAATVAGQAWYIHLTASAEL